MGCRKQSAVIGAPRALPSGLVVVLVTLTAAAASGCDLRGDAVLAGAYGPAQLASGSGAAPPRGQLGTVLPGSALPSAGAVAAPANVTGGGSFASAAGVPALQPMAAGTIAPPSAGSGGAQAEPTSAGPCDMTGRWLSTVHYVTDALGQLQYCHSFLYYEIQQTGASFAVTKGLQCGDDAVGTGDFATTVSFKASWATASQLVQHVGRAGKSEAVSGGCQVSLDKWYTVRGATLPYYLDPSIPLPTAQEQAMGSTPGWEDWDMDGNPGLSGTISGVVSGKVFVAPRQWTSMAGMVPDITASMRLPVLWDQEQNVMAFDGSPLLDSSAARAADASLHFAQLARLQPGQATGDDAAICASVIELAPTLTPDAAGN